MLQMVRDIFYLIDFIFKLIFLPFDFIFLNVIWLLYMDLLIDEYTYKQFISLVWKKFTDYQFIFRD